MGNEGSLPLDMCATFDAEEIKRLGKRRVFCPVQLDNAVEQQILFAGLRSSTWTTLGRSVWTNSCHCQNFSRTRLCRE